MPEAGTGRWPSACSRRIAESPVGRLTPKEFSNEPNGKIANREICQAKAP